jgi:hypothetical protein
MRFSPRCLTTAFPVLATVVAVTTSCHDPGELFAPQTQVGSWDIQSSTRLVQPANATSSADSMTRAVADLGKCDLSVIASGRRKGVGVELPPRYGWIERWNRRPSEVSRWKHVRGMAERCSRVVLQVVGPD